MDAMIETLNLILEAVNGILWHDMVLYTILGTGILFLLWSKFSPWIAISHGINVVRGRYDHADDPGAINHFQALSAALSATVGLGNIGGVAVAIALGGPGAIFWMWIVGLVGMAIKTVEVTQSMLYRNTDQRDDPHGGPMFVVSQGLAKMRPELAWLGKIIAIIFCVTLLVSTATGGNMFQAWNVGRVTQQNFGIPELVSGIILAIICALVIIGGIKRIGAVAGKLVPFMCLLYLVAAFYVLAVNFSSIPELLTLIVTSAFSPTDAQGAFLGGTFGYAFLWGMKRALFSNEAGQGSAPIAHSAAMTDEPVREGIVAGLEPFIDTIVVCTLTALVILASGAWNRDAVATFSQLPEIIPAKQPNSWTLQTDALPTNIESSWQDGQEVFVIVEVADVSQQTGNRLRKIHGTITQQGGQFFADWGEIESSTRPDITDAGIYVNFAGAQLTSHAFDRVYPGLGTWLVTIAAWLFAISTMISWSYYGEQGIIFMFGQRWVTSYKMFYCILIIVATSGFVTTDRELDNLTGLGTGVMLFANIPIMLIFSKQAMDAYHDYVRRLRAGKFEKNA